MGQGLRPQDRGDRFFVERSRPGCLFYPDAEYDAASIHCKNQIHDAEWPVETSIIRIAAIGLDMGEKPRGGRRNVTAS